MEESSTAQRVWDRPKEERDTLSFSASPTLISHTVLTKFAAGMEDCIFMMQDDCSTYLMRRRILPLRKDPFTHRSRWRLLMLTLTRIGRFLLDDNFSREASFLGSPLLFEHEKLHD